MSVDVFVAAAAAPVIMWSVTLSQCDFSRDLQHTAAPLSGCAGTCFYRAMLCIRGTSHGPMSVRPSVRHKSVFY